MERQITLCYRKIITRANSQHWDKLVFEDSYSEFRMQAQYFNQSGEYDTYAQLVWHVPGAKKLPFLVEPAVTGYIILLKEVIPDILDNLGKHFLKFSSFRFELINSSLSDPDKHQVAINFFSAPMIWHDTIGDCLLVSEKGTAEESTATSLFRLQPFLTICNLSTSTQPSYGITRENISC